MQLPASYFSDDDLRLLNSAILKHLFDQVVKCIDFVQLLELLAPVFALLRGDFQKGVFIGVSLRDVEVRQVDSLFDLVVLIVCKNAPKEVNLICFYSSHQHFVIQLDFVVGHKSTRDHFFFKV